MSLRSLCGNVRACMLCALRVCMCVLIPCCTARILIARDRICDTQHAPTLIVPPASIEPAFVLVPQTATVAEVRGDMFVDLIVVPLCACVGITV